MGRPVVHFEIGCRDTHKTQDCYAKLFNWKIESMGPAAMIAPDPSGIGGHLSALRREPGNYAIFDVDVAPPAILRKLKLSVANPGTNREYSHRQIRLDARSGWQYRGPLEG